MYKDKSKVSSLKRVAALLGTSVFLAAVAVIWSGPTATAYAPLSGAIFTTDVGCDGTNINIFSSKDAVYLDGGPAHPGAAGLPDGEYYVQVTEPNGVVVLGTSIGSSDETPAVVVNGEFQQCYQLSNILLKASDFSPGYDDTNNLGGEYKVWVSSSNAFDNSQSKTDNFKVKGNGDVDPPQATLHVVKYYDANANGIFDSGEQSITGWKFHIQDGIDYIRYSPVTVIVDPDLYHVTEFMTQETNWINTDPGPTAPVALSKDIVLADGDTGNVAFGNLCVGAGGGLTLGFWSNKNGQAIYQSNGSNAMLTALNLRTAPGLNFDPADYRAFRTWILSASATNMAYMLSAQLAAMELNVYNGKVDGTSLIYAPGATSANSLGFASVNDLMNEANISLGANGSTVSAGAVRTYQEALKNALDRANNNLNFVQGTPCSFSFPE
jgi:hypothetical protein